MRNQKYFEYWHDIASHFVAGNKRFYLTQIEEIMHNLDFPNMKPEFYPNASFGQRNLKKRKEAVNKLAESLWGQSPQDWLGFEKACLKKAREEAGNSRDDGKDDLDDVVSSQILVRIFATAYLFYKNKNHVVRKEALRSLNNFLETVIVKGYTRINKVEDRTIYTILTKAGLPVAASGKYLPHPEESFKNLLTLLHRDCIIPEVYK